MACLRASGGPAYQFPLVLPRRWEWRTETMRMLGANSNETAKLDDTKRPTHSCLSLQIFRFDVHHRIEIQWMYGATATSRASLPLPPPIF